MSGGRVLLIDDEEAPRDSLTQALDLAGYEVTGFASGATALERLSFGFPGVVVCDIRMPGLDGMTFLERAREIDPELPVILVTGHGDVQLAVRAMKEGAYDFVEKPFPLAQLITSISRAQDRRRLVLENRRLRHAVGKYKDDLELRLLGRSHLMVDLRYKIRAIAPTEADVLIIGETGTGKEVAARAIHDFSPRAGKPFVAINCAALPPNLIESELFGHEAGAYAGAMRARYGKFEHARGGTILLDEIGSMPLEVQAKLLRVIQERKITRLGSNEPVELDVRFIAASKADLDEEVAAGRFRADLLYRINVVTLRMPALAARRSDIPLLFLQLVAEAAARYHKSPEEVPPHVIASVAERDWPGNVRELRNAADRHVLGLDWVMDGQGEAAAPPALPLSDRVAEFEREVIAKSLIAHGGSLKAVYEALGMSRKTLYDKMRRYGLERREVGGIE